MGGGDGGGQGVEMNNFLFLSFSSRKDTVERWDAEIRCHICDAFGADRLVCHMCHQRMTLSTHFTIDRNVCKNFSHSPQKITRRSSVEMSSCCPGHQGVCSIIPFTSAEIHHWASNVAFTAAGKRFTDSTPTFLFCSTCF